jgi:hypothetical protein
MRSAGLVVGSLALLLAGCAAAPKLWARADGGPIMATQYETDATVCRGEMQKAALTQREAKIYLPGEQNPVAAVYAGCMAGRGYLLRAECPPTAGASCVRAE